MRLELSTLALSTVLGFIYLMAASHAATKVRGLHWNFSPRDEKLPELTGVPARLQRAFKNFMETYAFYAAATLLVHLMDRYSQMTLIGSQLYFWGRVAYLPVYALGIPYLRTMIWSVACFGIILLLLAQIL